MQLMLSVSTSLNAAAFERVEYLLVPCCSNHPMEKTLILFMDENEKTPSDESSSSPTFLRSGHHSPRFSKEGVYPMSPD
jgi:hypothetical protein